MKRLLLAPLLLTLIVGCSRKNEVKTDVSEVKTDVRLLCIRNQSAYDVSFRADSESNYYSMYVWLNAYKEEEKKFEDRGEKLRDWSVVDEPYKSIREEHNRLNNISQEKRHAYARTLVPILELAGYERPEFYLWYYTSSHYDIRERHNIINLNKVEEFGIGQDYYSHTGSGNDVRDELCKLYGYEFKDRYRDQKFKEKYKLKW